ncbi:unnamed protein product [Rhizophagus irregularis]|uniref:Uncharacterized protein n=1 Tax=Rhizophagus irregularis TaxID=588596 RepID=A0A916EE83_9GLOM|nr:unnamed protein product [Rhizophagus irregularis]CAB5217254.1 unnamed protein product [Rhizophagus irregularis]CAB5380889.1 unnamed protein product [Rhizophagus irregularis]
MVIILLLLRVSLKRRMETAGMKSVPRIGGVTEISRIPNSRPDRSFEKEMTNGTSTSINFYGDSQNNKDLIMSSATKRKCVTNIHTIINEKYHKNQRDAQDDYMKDLEYFDKLVDNVGLSYIGREEELTPPCGTMVANSWNSFKIEIGLRYFLSSYHESSGIKLFIQ